METETSETRNENDSVSRELRVTEDIVDFILIKKFSQMPYDDKIFITKTIKTPQPAMQNLIVNSRHNRSFCVQWYNKCEWLTGSTVRNKLFCWFCLLFSDDSENNVWSKLGHSDLKNLQRSIERHGRSKSHLGASIKFKLFGKLNIVNSLDQGHRQTIIDHNEKVKENRDILKRLLDAVMFLCFQELPFRGHDESVDSDNRGNFEELLCFISRYDSKLEKFLNDATVFSGTSKSIQNDLIEAVSFVVRSKIEAELQNSLFFAWQADETVDITCSSQLSIVFRYVNKEGQIVERFAGFFADAGRTADSLFKFLTETFNKLNLEKKLIAQTYDGASVMAGHLNGLQANIKNIAPQALFTHCYAHALNLVLSKACSGSIKECEIFFANLSGFSLFFSKSSKRTEVLNAVGSNRLPSNVPHLKVEFYI